MTELIVALDGPDPLNLLCRLYEDADIRWFKLGPQTMISGAFDALASASSCVVKPAPEIKIFLDLKLADTEDTCREAVRRFADAGIAAVSTFTNRATLAAMAGAGNSGLRVWRIAYLTDDIEGRAASKFSMKGLVLGHGVICPVADLDEFNITLVRYSIKPIEDRVCPGIRRSRVDEAHGHKLIATPAVAVERGATHIVVGRPIWQADDPVAAAKEFLAELRNDHA